MRSGTDVKARRTDGFAKQLSAAPARVHKDFEKQLGFLLHDPRHRSLRAKKFDETRGIFQARVNDAWRFYYLVDGDTYVLLSIIFHPARGLLLCAMYGTHLRCGSGAFPRFSSGSRDCR
jgi:mRNA-degrading endonuclease RelE of RelBE toxin-antitoxin system